LVESVGRALEISKQRAQTAILRSRENFRRKRMRECGNLTGWTTKPMIRHCACEGEPVFDHIQPVHAVLRRAHAAARSETAHCFKIALTAIEKIAVQRKNHVGAI